jgi:transcription antitermination protein NusB
MTLDLFKQREILFLLLYTSDMSKKIPDEEVLDLIATECKITKTALKEQLPRFSKIYSSLETIDAHLSLALKDYSLSRIFSTDRNILRLATYELMCEGLLPNDVIFSEAKRLAKKFSTEESSGFVQAVLSSVEQSKKMSQ